MPFDGAWEERGFFLQFLLVVFTEMGRGMRRVVECQDIVDWF